MTASEQTAFERKTVPCSTCGVALASSVCGQVCAACLFEAAIREPEGEALGPYRLLQPYDEGGHGIVYLAELCELDYLPELGDEVRARAVKIARPELRDNAEAMLAFRNGLRIQHALCDLPNVVKILLLGTHEDGRPYAGMLWFGGGTLADNRARFREPRAALALLVKLATAVHAAHQRGVLHCDLKPENVLFRASDADEPFVSDFGLARVVRGSALARGAAFAGGTPGWMSPEQARGGALTIATDVFSLGVLLYWLVDGRLPFGDGEDFAQRVMTAPPPALALPRWQALRREVEQICARALQSDPQQRYRSVAELADDLKCALSGHPLEAERRMPWRCAHKWARRHPSAALGLIQLAMLLFYLSSMPVAAFSALKHAVRTQIGFAATAQAGAVMNELRASASRLAQLALEPEVQRLVEHPNYRVAPAALIERAPSLAGGNDGVSVFSAEGIIRARWPVHSHPLPTFDYSFRDYFQGQLRAARSGRRDVYVARAFHSTGDDLPMLGLSTPMYADGEYVGALLVRTQAKDTFGNVQMNCTDRSTCMTALLGPRDRDFGETELPKSIFVLAAPGLRSGQELLLEASIAGTICARFACQPAPTNQFDPNPHPGPLVLEEYRDPITHVPSMAAVAPVGRAGLFVVVSAPHNALEALIDSIRARIWTFFWIPMVLGVLLFGAVVAGPALLRRVLRARALRP